MQGPDSTLIFSVTTEDWWSCSISSEFFYTLETDPNDGNPGSSVPYSDRVLKWPQCQHIVLSQIRILSPSVQEDNLHTESRYLILFHVSAGNRF